jgi:hypothetical protein
MPIHTTLKAWQHAQRLAVECAKAANAFPDSSNRRWLISSEEPATAFP